MKIGELDRNSDYIANGGFSNIQLQKTEVEPLLVKILNGAEPRNEIELKRELNLYFLALNENKNEYEIEKTKGLLKDIKETLYQLAPDQRKELDDLFKLDDREKTALYLQNMTLLSQYFSDKTQLEVLGEIVQTGDADYRIKEEIQYANYPLKKFEETVEVPKVKTLYELNDQQLYSLAKAQDINLEKHQTKNEIIFALNRKIDEDLESKLNTNKVSMAKTDPDYSPVSVFDLKVQDVKDTKSFMEALVENIRKESHPVEQKEPSTPKFQF